MNLIRDRAGPFKTLNSLNNVYNSMVTAGAPCVAAFVDKHGKICGQLTIIRDIKYEGLIQQKYKINLH